MIYNELDIIEQKARSGDQESILYLLDYYLKEKQYDKASYYLDVALYQKLPAAYRKQGYCYETGLIYQKDSAKAKASYRMAMEKGDMTSGYNYALLLLKENIESIEARSVLKQTARQGHIRSNLLLAKLENDISYLEYASELHDDNASILLGEHYLKEKKEDEAFYYFEKASHHPKGLYYLALCYQKGYGVKADQGKAFHYFKESAKSNLPLSLMEVSLYYQKGITVNQSDALAAFYMKKAVEHGLKHI